MKKLLTAIALAFAIAAPAAAASPNSGTLVVVGPSGTFGELSFEVYGTDADAVDLVCTNGTDLLLALNRTVTDPELGAGEATPVLWTYNDDPGSCTATVAVKSGKWNWRLTNLQATFVLP